MTWSYPLTTWGLLLVPVVVAAALIGTRLTGAALTTIGRNRISWQVRSFLRDLIIVLFTALCVLAAADPRSGRRPVAGERSGLDVAVAFDVSRSMLAEDLSPSRLNRGTTALRQLFGGLENSRFSLTAFKGDAVLLVPMTEDRVILELWMSRMSPGLSTAAGTNIEAALTTAVASFPGGEGQSRIVLLISDGESLDGRIDRAVRELVETGIPVFVLAVGSTQGSTIPIGNNGYVRDGAGRPVVSRADFEGLKRIAEETGGSFHELSRPGAVTELTSSVNELRRFTETRGIHFIGVNRYRSFLLPALLVLLLYLLARIVPWRN